MVQKQQGDVCLESGVAIPDGAKLVKQGVKKFTLAYGEVSGHAHVAVSDEPFDVYEVEEDGLTRYYLKAVAALRVQHGRRMENGTIVAEPGTHAEQVFEHGEVVSANQVVEADPFSEMVSPVED